MQKKDLGLTKNYISPTEQRIFQLFSESKKIHTPEEIRSMFPGKKINQALSSLAKKQYILRLKRSHYVSKEAFLESPYKIASNLEGGVLCFMSALKMHGLIDYEPNVIFLMADSSYTIKVLNHTIRYMKLKHRTGIEEKEGVFLTSIEKTIVDCIARPEFAGGYLNIINSVRYGEIRWEELLSHIERYGKSSIYQKMGYLMSRIGRKMPLYFEKRLKSKVKNNVRMLSNQSLPYKYNREWRIMDNLGEQEWS